MRKKGKNRKKSIDEKFVQ